MILKFALRGIAVFLIPCLLTDPTLASLRTFSTRSSSVDVLSFATVLNRQALALAGTALLAGTRRYSARAFFALVKDVEAGESGPPSIARHSPFQKGLNNQDANELAKQYLESGSELWTNGWMKALFRGFDQRPISGWNPIPDNEYFTLRTHIIVPLLQALNKGKVALSSQENVEIHWVKSGQFVSRDRLRAGDGFVWREPGKLHIFAAAVRSEDVRSIVLHELTETIAMNLFGLDESQRAFANFLGLMMERIEGAFEMQVKIGISWAISSLPLRFHGEIGHAKDLQLRAFISETEEKKRGMDRVLQTVYDRPPTRIPKKDFLVMMGLIRVESQLMSNVLRDLARQELQGRAKDALRAA